MGLISIVLKILDACDIAARKQVPAGPAHPEQVSAEDGGKGDPEPSFRASNLVLGVADECLQAQQISVGDLVYGLSEAKRRFVSHGYDPPLDVVDDRVCVHAQSPLH